MNRTSERRQVLLVDTLSSMNDFGVDLPIALDPLVDLTVFTIKGTRLKMGDCARIIDAFPEYWGSAGKFSKLAAQIHATFRLAREIVRHRNGTVHVQFFRSPAFEFPLYVLARPFLKQLVCTVHNALPHEVSSWDTPLYQFWYWMLDRIHVLSHYTEQVLIRDFGVASKKIVYAPHGNYDRFRQTYPPNSTISTRKALGVTPGQKVVLCCGQIRQYKGVDRLINAANLVQTSQVKFLIAGGCDEHLAADLHSKIKDGKLEGRIDLKVGYVENQTLSDYIAAADLVVFPYHHIYQSGAVLLAMTYGKPVLVSDLEGFREYVTHGKTGWVCNTADPQAFANGLDEVLGNSAMATMLGNGARRACETEYDWKNIARTIVQTYREDSC